MNFRLWARFRRLTLWNQLAVIASLLSFLGVFPAVVWYWDRLFAVDQRAMGQQEIDRLAESLVARTLTRTQERLQEYEAEVRSLRSALKSLKAGTEPKYQLAMSKLKEGDTKLAEELFADIARAEAAAGAQANAAAAKALRNLGAITWLRDPNKALDTYTRSTELDPRSLEGWLSLGQLRLQLDQLDGAEIALSEVLKRAGNHDSELGPAYRALSRLNIKRGATKRAMELALLSLSAERRANNKDGVGDAYEAIGKVYQAEKKYQRAYGLYCKSLLHAESANDKAGEASALWSIAELYRAQGKIDDAIDSYVSSLRYSAAAGISCGMATAYSSMGNLYSELKDDANAEQMYARGLAIYERLGWKQQIAEHRNALALIARKQIRFDEACVHWRIARQLYGDLGRSNEARNIASWMLITSCHAR